MAGVDDGQGRALGVAAGHDGAGAGAALRVGEHVIVELAKFFAAGYPFVAEGVPQGEGVGPHLT